jgi:hypothetical protein
MRVSQIQIIATFLGAVSFSSIACLRNGDPLAAVLDSDLLTCPVCKINILSKKDLQQDSMCTDCRAKKHKQKEHKIVYLFFSPLFLITYFSFRSLLSRMR